MRPALRAGLLPLWRDQDTIQIGVDPRRAVAIAGAGAAAGLIALLDGSRDRQQLIAAAGQTGIPEPVAERVLTLLAAAGMLVDYPAGLFRSLPPGRREQILPELAAVSIARQDGDGGAVVLARRAGALVHVQGDGRIADGIADLLAASGVFGVRQDRDRAEAAPDGTGPDRGGRVTHERPPTILVLAGQLPDPAAGPRRVPHLTVAASEAIGVVGPLVRPGLSACLRCLDLARADRDPAWPLILAQLALRQAEPVACDAALAAAVAAQAVMQVLHFIDWPGRPSPAQDATLELVRPGWQWRRRRWPPHPACACRAADGYLGTRDRDGDQRGQP